METLLLRVEEFARLIDVGRSTAYEIVWSGELPTVRIGRSIRIPREAIEQWIKRRAGLLTEETVAE